MAECYSSVLIFHIWFFHSLFIMENLCCFYFGAFMNNEYCSEHSWTSLFFFFSMYRLLCEHLFSIFLDIDRRVELVTLNLTFWGTAKLSPKEVGPFYNSASNVWVFKFSRSSPTIVFFVLAMLVGVKWYLIVVLICIFLMLKWRCQANIFSCAHWPFVYLLWGNVCF